jgi:hypothetical protein
VGGAGLGGNAESSTEEAPLARAAIAARSLRRSPITEMPIPLRSSTVSCGRTSASILLFRNLSSYSPRPRPRSQSPTSIAAPHMAWLGLDSRLQSGMCPAMEPSTTPARALGETLGDFGALLGPASGEIWARLGLGAKLIRPRVATQHWGERGDANAGVLDERPRFFLKLRTWLCCGFVMCRNRMSAGPMRSSNSRTGRRRLTCSEGKQLRAAINRSV